MQHRWTAPALPPAEKVDALQKALGIARPLCQLLVQRGVESYEGAREFFRPDLRHLHDPFLMKDMDKAVSRIETARAKGEKIMIYGDYDVDGTTSVAALYSFLGPHYPLPLTTYIPDRYKEGYGVSRAGIEQAAAEGISLIIALDCGIKAHEQVRYAAEKGIDFIICDHHLPDHELPPAVAVLDPARPDCSYPYPKLSGCGVGFKLVQALCQRWQLPDQHWKRLLDLLAVSIGADIVPITGENRTLAYFGLRLINEQPRKGLSWLRKIAGKDKKPMNIRDVVFTLGPRINAAGRIAHGKLAVNLLTQPDEKVVAEVSNEVNDHNTHRQQLDRNITQEALAMIKDLGEEERYTTVLHGPQWHKGVIGIVASRLIENYYRPTVVFTGEGEVIAGSARSVEGFDLYAALEACQEHLQQFGGHRAAAGMSMRRENFPAFKARFEEVVQERILPEQRQPELQADLTVRLADLDHRFYRVLRQFAPFGPGNMAPVLACHHLQDVGCRAVGSDHTHLRVVLRENKSDTELSGIGFGMADKMKEIDHWKGISALFHLEENEYRGQKNLQLRVLDLKPTEVALPELEKNGHQLPTPAN
jgi:single-stranded-DNA-specific exonuclease